MMHQIVFDLHLHDKVYTFFINFQLTNTLTFSSYYELKSDSPGFPQQILRSTVKSMCAASIQLFQAIKYRGACQRAYTGRPGYRTF
jgi:hypothetical protein